MNPEREKCPKCNSTLWHVYPVPVTEGDYGETEISCAVCGWDPYRRTPTEAEKKWAQEHYVTHDYNKVKTIPTSVLMDKNIPISDLCARYNVRKWSIKARRANVRRNSLEP